MDAHLFLNPLLCTLTSTLSPHSTHHTPPLTSHPYTGDSLEDANFDRQVANQAITYLYNEEEWIRGVFADVAKGALRTGECGC